MYTGQDGFGGVLVHRLRLGACIIFSCHRVSCQAYGGKTHHFTDTTDETPTCVVPVHAPRSSSSSIFQTGSDQIPGKSRMGLSLSNS